MADFTPITTQAEFDAAIADRLARQEKSITARFEGMISKEDAQQLRAGYEQTIEGLKKQQEEAANRQQESDRQLAELAAKVKGYETDSEKTRIALEYGLPYQLATRLAGETEEEIRRDAEQLRGMIAGGKPAAPLAKDTPAGANTRDKFADWFGDTMGR